jgi:hypothetical protein
MVHHKSGKWRKLVVRVVAAGLDRVAEEIDMIRYVCVLVW